MSSSSTIAISANTSWYLYNFRSNLILNLIDQGHQVVAIAPRDRYSNRLTSLSQNVEFVHIEIDQGGTNPIRDILTALSFRSILQKYEFSLILNFTPKNNIYATIAASQLNIPAINNISGLGSAFIEQGLVARIAKALYRYSQKRASYVFFQNQEDQNLFRENGISQTKNSERLPGSGVDLTRFKKSPLPSDGKMYFLLVARMLYEKGVKEFVLAAKSVKNRYPNANFRIVGIIDAKNPSAIPRQEISKWEESGYIVFGGASDNVEEEISKASCVVLPSYYREGVPRSLLEAAAMGRPLITTDSTGCRDTVNEGINGYMCEARSVDSLVSCMEKLLRLSKDELHEMGEKSRELVEERFDENIVLNAYSRVISQLL